VIASAAVAQQALVCPTSASAAGRPCETFHYHVQMYRPDTRQFVEVFGVNQFATQAACERAREQQMAANAKLASWFKNVREQQYEPDRFGSCHCDMTIDRISPNFLTDGQRTMQLRTAEEIRLRVRERLLDNKLTSDSELVRDLWADPPITPLLSGAKIAPLPSNGPVAVTTSPDDLRPTKSLDTTKPAIAALDLPLADVGAPPVTPAAEDGTATPDAPPATEAAPEPPVETVNVEAPEATAPQESQPEKVVTAEEAPTEADVQSAQETAERFVTYETQRIQNVLRASAAIADETVKSKIFESCMQRIQLLSNLRLLIEGSGMRSRLAAAARTAESETERLALIARLFGDDVKPHWAPADAADVIFEIEPDIVAAPERALRDTTGQFSAQQKKRALYLVLAQTQPTEDQRLWLSTVIEGFLR